MQKSDESVVGQDSLRQPHDTNGEAAPIQYFERYHDVRRYTARPQEKHNCSGSNQSFDASLFVVRGEQHREDAEKKDEPIIIVRSQKEGKTEDGHAGNGYGTGTRSAVECRENAPCNIWPA